MAFRDRGITIHFKSTHFLIAFAEHAQSIYMLMRNVFVKPSFSLRNIFARQEMNSLRKNSKTF